MKKAKSRLFLISMILAVLSASLVFAYLKSLDKPKVEAVMVSVLVANNTIEARTMIEEQMLKLIKVPDNELVKAYIKDANSIVGKYAKSTIEKNEGFLAAKLMDKEQNAEELTVKIDKNHRAVSINATGESGVSKLVKPNDYVDVFVFLTEKVSGEKIIRPELSKMILQNVKVLAIDRKLIRQASTVEEESNVTSFLVTLSVSVDEVGKLMLAEDIGKIKLALRADDKEKNVVPRTTTEQELLGSNISTKIAQINENTKESSKTLKTDTKPSSKTKVSYKYYTVKAGDTLMSISRKFYKNNESYKYIMKANKIADINNILVGTKIRIPMVIK